MLCERGVERIVALLGILKAGAVYLPISPALPDQRIAMMLDDTNAAVEDPMEEKHTHSVVG